MKLEAFLQPGDVLLYRPTGLFGKLIALKTWHKVGHCETYIGAFGDLPAAAAASRDGKGVHIYPLRTKDLFRVCRPNVPLDLEKALVWYHTVAGEPYGWKDLLCFLGLEVDGRGMVCSPFCARFQRAGGVNGFGSEPSQKIAPFQFDVSPTYDDWTVTDGEVAPEPVYLGT
jgi:hypothetical protein